VQGEDVSYAEGLLSFVTSQYCWSKSTMRLTISAGNFAVGSKCMECQGIVCPSVAHVFSSLGYIFLLLSMQSSGLSKWLNL
jgi:hypothetical protein